MNKVNMAITRVITRNPFFAPGILRLQTEEDNTIKTLSTNGIKLKVNTDFFKALSTKEQNFVILHEWCHIMFRHHLRKGTREMKRWQAAVDFEVNNYLTTLPGISLPQGGLYEKEWEKLSAEQIYDLLPEVPPDQDGMPGQFGDVEPHPGQFGDNGQPDPVKVQKIENDVKMALSAGMQMAKQQGKLPAELERLLGGLVEPKIDWRSELISFVQEQTKDDYSTRRVNTRFLHTGFILPTLYSEQLGTLVFACDTSGSITEKEINEYTSDLIYAFNSVPMRELLVIWCDSSIKSIQSFLKGDDIQLKPKGGGGTNFAPPFRHVEKEEINCAGLIYLTDGYCDDFYRQEPEYPVLWIVYGSNKDFKPPYGRVLKID